MKNIFKSSLLLACGVLMLTACSDDNDSNPTLLKPATFTLNTPAYSTAGIDLQTSQTVNFTWSQPDYGFPAATEYELQISKDGNYTVSIAQAAADETGETLPNYTNIANVYQTCNAAVPATEIANALMQFYKWSDGELPEEVTFYARASAVTKGTEKIYSNNVQVTVKPYYVELSDAPIVLWYMVGDCFVNDKNEGWKNESGGIGKGLTPLLPKVGAEFEKTTGLGTLEYTGYFPAGAQFKFVQVPGSWDTQMNYTNGDNLPDYITDEDNDNHNVGVSEEGYYTITMDTKNNKFTIAKYEGTVKTFAQIFMPGDHNEWDITAAINPMLQKGEVHQWFVTDFTLAKAAGVKFMDGTSSWDVNWGAADFPYGIGTQGGANIPVKAGTYDVYFNDISGVYYFIEK